MMPISLYHNPGGVDSNANWFFVTKMVSFISPFFIAWLASHRLATGTTSFNPLHSSLTAHTFISTNPLANA